MATATKNDTETRLMIRCDYLNETKGHIFGQDPEWVEAFTDNRARLFLDCQREYGRCVSSIYADGTGSQSHGWVFQKRMQYEDYRGRGERFYVREVWVHVKEEEFPESDD